MSQPYLVYFETLSFFYIISFIIAFRLIKLYSLSPVSVPNIHYLQDIIGDKGYLSETIPLDLFNDVNIKLQNTALSVQKI